LAIDFLHPDEPTFPTEVAICQGCGLFTIDHPSIKLVDSRDKSETESGSDTEQDPKPRRGRNEKRPWHADGRPGESNGCTLSDFGISHPSPSQTMASPLLEKMVQDLSKRPEVLVLACAMRSRNAVVQLRNLLPASDAPQDRGC
jgi:hypothetical protein